MKRKTRMSIEKLAYHNARVTPKQRDTLKWAKAFVHYIDCRRVLHKEPLCTVVTTQLGKLIKQYDVTHKENLNNDINDYPEQ